jgi:hypothetical protein
MDQNQGQAVGAVWFSLPVAMATHSASVEWIDLNRFKKPFRREWRTRKKIAYDGLEVATAEAPPGPKREEPRGRAIGMGRESLFIFVV